MNNNFFKNRLGELYDFSIIKTELGKGTLLDNNNKYEVNWALNMDLKGEITFVVTLNRNIPCERNGEFIKYHLNGYTTDKVWLVTCKNINLNTETFNTETEKIIYLGIANIIEFKKKSYEQKKCYKSLTLKAAINNFKFNGLEFEKRGTRFIRNKFTSILFNKSIEFKLKDNTDDIDSLIKSKRIESAIMSYLSFDVEEKYDAEKINDFLIKICWFISLITLNTTFIPYIEIIDERRVVYKKLRGNILNYKYSDNGLIDNLCIKSGIKNILESNFSKFVSLKDDLEITKFIHTLLKIEKESTIEFKLVFLILAYEQIATKFLLLKGTVTEDKIKDYNIQQKIQEINSIFKFIPKSYNGDDLRGNVRNDIFHLGEIPLLNSEQKINIFNKYYDLLCNILFRILEYDGEYISRNSHKSVNVNELYTRAK